MKNSISVESTSAATIIHSPKIQFREPSHHNFFCCELQYKFQHHFHVISEQSPVLDLCNFEKPFALELHETLVGSNRSAITSSTKSF